jgi:heme/copper-type cytochrome/quinol oxidase subunit 4
MKGRLKMKYLKSYSLGVLLGLILCSSAFLKMDDIKFTFQVHWYVVLIFSPALIYFISNYTYYNQLSFNKQHLKESFPFTIGLVLSSLVVISIWGLPIWLR